MGWFSSGVGGAGAGAATGAAIGSIIPGIGTAIGAGVGALAGGLLGGASGAETSAIDKNKSFRDLPWYDRVASTLAAKGEGLTRSVAGLVGLEDEIGTENQDVLDRLKYERSDDFGTSFQSGGSISGAIGGETSMPQMGGVGGAGATPNSGISLGKALAIEEEPALEEVNYNNNNFSF